MKPSSSIIRLLVRKDGAEPAFEITILEWSPDGERVHVRYHSGVEDWEMPPASCQVLAWLNVQPSAAPTINLPPEEIERQREEAQARLRERVAQAEADGLLRRSGRMASRITSPPPAIRWEQNRDGGIEIVVLPGYNVTFFSGQDSATAQFCTKIMIVPLVEWERRSGRGE